MPVRQRSDGTNQWQVDVRQGAKRWRLNAANRAQADAWEKGIKADLAAGREPDLERLREVRGTTVATLGAAADMVKSRHWAQIRSSETAGFNIDRAVRVIGPNLPLARLGHDEVYAMVETLEDEGLSNATINRTLSALRTVLRLAGEWHLIDTKPPKLPHLKESRGRIRFLQPGEEQRLLGMALHLGLADAADYWSVLLDTGARAREVLGLTWEDLRTTPDGFSHVTFWQTKADLPRTLPLTERAKVIFQRRRSSHLGPFSTFDYDRARAWWDRVKGVLDLGADNQWVMHMLRHTCISRLVQNGAPIKFVQEWAGHRRIETTMRYAHLCPSNLDGLVSMLQPEALVAEVVDAPALEAGPVRGVGSSPAQRTNIGAA